MVCAVGFWVVIMRVSCLWVFVFCLGVRVVVVFWFGLLVRGFFGVCGWLGLLWIGLLVSGVSLDLGIWLGC